VDPATGPGGEHQSARQGGSAKAWNQSGPTQHDLTLKPAFVGVPARETTKPREGMKKSKNSQFGITIMGLVSILNGLQVADSPSQGSGILEGNAAILQAHQQL
jgi:hypothetical protein